MRVGARFLIGMGLFVGLSSCGSHGIQYPESGGAAWRELTTDHFVIDTDLNDEDGAAAAKGFEQIYDSLRSVAFSATDAPEGKPRVFLLRNVTEYEEFGPKHTGGFFIRYGLNAIEPTPVVFVYGPLLIRTRQIIQHELTHRFVRHYFPQAPRWLNEGLAEYYSTLELRGDDAIAGRRPPLAVVKGMANGLLVSVDELPTVQELLASDGAAFLPPQTGRTGGGEYEVGMRRVEGLYAASWGLVHMFMDDPSGYGQSFDKYLELLHGGQSHEKAWQQSFTGEILAKIDGDFRAFWSRQDTQISKTKYVTPNNLAVSTRALPPAEVRTRIGRARWWDGESRARAEADLNAAAALAPSDAAPRTAKGLFLLRKPHPTSGDMAPAKAEFEQALSFDPHDEEALAGLIVTAPTAQVPALFEKLAQIAKSQRSFELLARYQLAAHHIDASLAFHRKALSLDPVCAQCLDGFAMALYAKGDLEGAVRAQRLAVNSLPDGDRSEGFVVRQRKYESEWKRSGASSEVQ